MKYHDNGSLYSVTVTQIEVEEFKSQWPCSPLPSCSFWFQFDKRTGDIVDLEPSNEQFDGPALKALSDVAQAYGQKQWAGYCELCFSAKEKRQCNDT